MSTRYMYIYTYDKVAIEEENSHVRLVGLNLYVFVPVKSSFREEERRRVDALTTRRERKSEERGRADQRRERQSQEIHRV